MEFKKSKFFLARNWESGRYIWSGTREISLSIGNCQDTHILKKFTLKLIIKYTLIFLTNKTIFQAKLLFLYTQNLLAR